MSFNNLADDVPSDIWGEILLRLPAECLFRLRAVCKRWCKVIDDPNFSRAHTSSFHTLLIQNNITSGNLSDILLSYTFDLDAIDGDVRSISGGYSLDLDLPNNESPPFLLSLPVSTCNDGLMLVITTDCTPKAPIFEIWNLSTHERLQLPPLLDISPSNLLLNTLTGLGYDHATQDYKVVAIQQGDGQQAHVYSLRSDTWRKLTGDCPCIDMPPQKEGVYMCGSLHWLSSSLLKIVALDLGTEKHRHIQLPHPIEQEKVVYHYRNIDALGGCLVLSAVTVSDDFVVWLMKDYGSPSSWSKLLSIKRDHRLPSKLLAYMKDKNQQVLLKDSGSDFLLWDVESNSIKKRVRIGGLPRYSNAQIIIPRTIFRLRDYCGGGCSGITRIKPKRKFELSVTISST